MILSVVELDSKPALDTWCHLLIGGCYNYDINLGINKYLTLIFLLVEGLGRSFVLMVNTDIKRHLPGC